MPTLNLCTHAPRLSKHRAKAGAVHARACTGVGSVCAWQLRVRVCPCRTGVVGGGCWWLLSDAEVTSLQILLTRICLRCAGRLSDARGQVTKHSPRPATTIRTPTLDAQPHARGRLSPPFGPEADSSHRARRASRELALPIGAQRILSPKYRSRSVAAAGGLGCKPAPSTSTQNGPVLREASR
jgi:hypothetical protein